jgi:hypothetical protein
VKPGAAIHLVQTRDAVTLTVHIDAAKVGSTSPCAGVALAGTLSTTLALPLGNRKLLHGPVSAAG